MGVRPELLTERHRTCAGRWRQIFDGSSVIHTPVCVVTELLFHQINNAGCMVNQRELTQEGLEKNFATNTLGKIYFVKLVSEQNLSFKFKEILV